MPPTRVSRPSSVSRSRSATEAPGENAVGKARILIVDDDAAIRSSLQRILEYEEYDVRAAESGEAALQALADRRFDLALLDVKMPGMDGLELLERVKRTWAELVCI